MTNHAVGVRISILQGDVNGTVVYMETQATTTNSNGLMTLQIGEGSVVSGDMSAIDWANGPFFLKTEIDPTGGANYTIEGTQQLLSVPYALYAQEAHLFPVRRSHAVGGVCPHVIGGVGRQSGEGAGEAARAVPVGGVRVDEGGVV